MRLNKFSLYLVFFLFTFSSFAQSNNYFYGSFESNGVYYQESESTDYDEKFASNTYLNLKYNLDNKKFSSCILITAIADDFSLVKELKEHDIELITYKYPDHYQFKESDIPKVDQPILVTEKDFVKIKPFCNENIYILEQNIKPNDKLLKLMEKLL